MKRGVFITLEGGEGSGKSSLIRCLSHYLSSEQQQHIITREPGGSPLSEEIRHVILHSSKAEGITPLAELLLFIAARIEHVDKVIEPALNKGISVLCDRFTDSSVAYQGYGRGCDPDRFWQLSTQLVPLLPDLTLYLDVSPDVAFGRLHSDRDRLESESILFHERVRTGYRILAEKFPERIIVIDASLSEEQLAKQAQDIVRMWLKRNSL